jgi:aminoglycoside phosphotransferase family enzyme/predicted kinase
MASWVNGLLRPDAWDPPTEGVELLETHISWVFLVGDFAYKLKKPVDFGFVDFTTRERRRHFCDEEVRLNRRLAPDLYLDVVPVYGPMEQPSLRGTGEPIDHMVKMRRFPQTALLSDAVARGDVRPDQWDRFAFELARFHAAAPVANCDTHYGAPDSVRRQQLANLATLERCLTPHEVIGLRDIEAAEFDTVRSTMERRKADGHVRECHGDLHLGNMLLRNDHIEAFDCLEFNSELRWIDTISELAFLVMDLADRGHPTEGTRVLNGWLEATGDYEGLAVWKWYVAYRALVRAKVAALRIQQMATDDPAIEAVRTSLSRYVDTAREALRPRRPGLILTKGLSGAGKSVVAGRLTEALNGVRVRSDVERKRMFGLWGEPRVAVQSGDPYSESVTERLYGETLPRLAGAIVSAGYTAVVDATFLKAAHRRWVQEWAEKRGVPWLILDVRVPEGIARERIERRRRAGQDPSDADIEVYERQLRSDEPLDAAELDHTIIVDGTNPDIDDIVRRCRQEGIEAV